MSSAGGPTILLDVFLTNQHRKRMIEAALAQTDLPAADYPLYVLVGAEGPWTPTGLSRRLEMPLSTMLFRLGRLERRGHAERVPNPDDRRSYLIRLTKEGERLLGEARPAFRDYAEAVEGRLGPQRVAKLRAALDELRQAVLDELEARARPVPPRRRRRASRAASSG
jgi:DNA-binding MarR family transcriptional regulator